MFLMLDIILKKLAEYPTLEPLPQSTSVREAAVLIALTKEESPHLVLTRRADHLNDHAGEVALPGGMWDKTDSSLLATALRESHEEVSLHPSEVEVVATLPLLLTRLDVPVTPFVGLIAADAEMEPELSELDAVFKVPLEYLLNLNNLQYCDFKILGAEYPMPCYHFDGFIIWGFTLGLLVEFLNDTLDAGIILKYPDCPELTRKVDRFKRERDKNGRLGGE
jgi:8-oxo-dGTP pyrophosphatase MutT (NUDIX family)